MKEQTISNLKKLKSFHNGSYGADIDKAIHALEQQPCEDAVSRQALIDKATSWDAHLTDSERAVSLEDIMSLPSVTPQPKTAEWIKTFEPNEAEPFILFECSNCHKTVRGDMKSDYCPNCGADMGGDEDDNK
jgi:hypothetical protein